MPSLKLSPALSANWLRYLASLITCVGLSLGFLRFFFFDRLDPLHCDALINRGRWIDDSHTQWQPDGCMLHQYQPKDASLCLGSQRVVFVGDSVTRTLYFQFAQLVDPNLPGTPPDNEKKHSNYSYVSNTGIHVDFIWDPFLNVSHFPAVATQPANNLTSGNSASPPAMVVLGSGLWYIRYGDTSGGLSGWEANIASALSVLGEGYPDSHGKIILLPVEEVLQEKLSPERYETMHPSDIDAMNADLNNLITLAIGHVYPAYAPSIPFISTPLVFNRMLDPSQTKDGLHYSSTAIKAQANILLNLRCNEALPKKFPLDKTCCRSYPTPHFWQFLILTVVVLWGPYVWLSTRKPGQSILDVLIKEEGYSALIYSAAIGLIFIADRSGFWMKEHKVWSPWTFTFLSLASLVVGLLTVKPADKDLGFLNRDQTDEWKGWMQIAILLYHYLGASKIIGIYNPIRVLVAAYLFMTGYGHTTFYIKKADFSFLRIAQIMVRLNTLALTLAYTMNTDYLSYYFPPLVSIWFLVIYSTMAIGSKFNDRLPFVLFKIMVSTGITTWFVKSGWMLETLFSYLEWVFAIHWSAQEWSFRVTLDLFIVYFGMLTSLVVIKVREHHLTDQVWWPLSIKIASGVSIGIFFWFFSFSHSREGKFAYNAWHPYISFLPIMAFVVLRNAHPTLRSVSSRAFTWIGTCSLETFVIQFHLWLAADTKGVLVIIPGANWRSVNFVVTSIIFLYVSHRMAIATGEITQWICGTEKDSPKNSQSLPTTTAGAYTSVPSGDVASEGAQPLESTSRRTLDRLAESTQGGPVYWWEGPMEGNWGVKAKLVSAGILMWLANLLWRY